MKLGVVFSGPLDGPTGSPMRLRAILSALDRAGARLSLCRIHRHTGMPVRGEVLGRDVVTTPVHAFPSVASLQWLKAGVQGILAVQETAAVASWPLAKLRRLPLIYDYHSVWDAEDKLRHGRIRKRVAAKRWVERKAMGDFHRTVVLSHAVLDVLHREGVPRDRLTVIYPGVPEAQLLARPTPALIPELGEADQVVLYAGNFQEYQGLPMLIDAFSRCVRQNPRARLVIVGGTREQYETQNGSLGEAPWTVFLGRRPHEEIPSLLARADVLALPRPQSRISQTTATKLVEYLAAGKPIACTAVGDHRLLVEKAGAGVVTEPDAPSLARGISDLLASSELRIRSGLAARKVAEGLTEEKQYGKMASLLGEAVMGR